MTHNGISDKIGNWVYDNTGWAIGLLCAALLALTMVSAMETAKSRQAFMEACQQDHKEYECVAMWRAGELNTQVIPVPIVIPSGR